MRGRGAVHDATRPRGFAVQSPFGPMPQAPHPALSPQAGRGGRAARSPRLFSKSPTDAALRRAARCRGPRALRRAPRAAGSARRRTSARERTRCAPTPPTRPLAAPTARRARERPEGNIAPVVKWRESPPLPASGERVGVRGRGAVHDATRPRGFAVQSPFGHMPQAPHPALSPQAGRGGRAARSPRLFSKSSTDAALRRAARCRGPRALRRAPRAAGSARRRTSARDKCRPRTRPPSRRRRSPA